MSYDINNQPQENPADLQTQVVSSSAVQESIDQAIENLRAWFMNHM